MTAWEIQKLLAAKHYADNVVHARPWPAYGSGPHFEKGELCH
jgi:hypothetical protein